MMDASVIIPAYQHAAFIRQSVESVLSQQTTFQFEVLIVDDASTDGTKEIIHDLLLKYQGKVKLHYIQNEYNLGMMANLRNAFRLTKGRYIFMCEGDDYWTSNDKLDYQCHLLDERPELQLSMHEGNVLWPDDKFTLATGILECCDLTATNLIADQTVTGSFAFRRSLIDPYPDWFDKLLAFDRALKIYAADRGVVHFSNRVMSVYRKHPGGYWTGKNNRNMILSSCLNLHLIDKSLNYRYTDAIQERITSRLKGLTSYMDISEKIVLHLEWIYRKWTI